MCNLMVWCVRDRLRRWLCKLSKYLTGISDRTEITISSYNLMLGNYIIGAFVDICRLSFDCSIGNE